MALECLYYAALCLTHSDVTHFLVVGSENQFIYIWTVIISYKTYLKLKCSFKKAV